MSSEGNKDMSTEAVPMEQSSTSAGAKRKRGRPRKYEYPSYELPQRAQPIQSIPPLQSAQGSSNIRQDGVQANHTPGDSTGPKPCTFQVLPAQQAQGKDDIIGKRFVGKMTNKFPGFCLITVKVKENQVLKGWVPNLNNLNPITPKDDLMSELPMLQPSQVQKKASAIPMQAGSAASIHLEDVTLAKPLRMRRPSNVELGTSAKQDSECMISQSPVAAVPITAVRPVSVSGKQANQNEIVGEKSFNDFQKDSESSNGTEDSSVKAEKPIAALVDVLVKDSPVLNVQGTDAVGESSSNSQHVNTTVNDEIKMTLEKSDLLKTQNVVLEETDGSKSVAPDDVQHMMNTK